MQKRTTIIIKPFLLFLGAYWFCAYGCETLGLLYDWRLVELAKTNPNWRNELTAGQISPERLFYFPVARDFANMLGLLVAGGTAIVATLKRRQPWVVPTLALVLFYALGWFGFTGWQQAKRVIYLPIRLGSGFLPYLLIGAIMVVGGVWLLISGLRSNSPGHAEQQAVVGPHCA